LKEGIDFYGLVLFYEYLVFCVNVKTIYYWHIMTGRRICEVIVKTHNCIVKKLETFYAKD